MFNSATRAYLLGVKNTFGQPLFIPNPNGGAFDSLLGRPVVLNQAMPSIGVSTKTVIFGDLSQGYLFRNDGDLSIPHKSRLAGCAGDEPIGFAGILSRNDH